MDVEAAWNLFEHSAPHSKEKNLAHLNKILCTLDTDGNPLLHLEKKPWHTSRGPEYFRNLKLPDEIRPKIEEMLKKLDSLVHMCSGLRETIDMLRMPVQVRHGLPGQVVHADPWLKAC